MLQSTVWMSSRRLARTWPYKRYSDYERNLRIAAAAWFARKDFATNPRRKYLLESRDNWPQNIICEDVSKYIEQESNRHLGQRPYPLHKYLHHGLSSQAMTFNLIGPLIVRNDLEPLKQCVTAIGIPWPGGVVKVEFEHEDREFFNEDSGQPTSFDIFVSGDIGNIFIESKLVEREFGGCSVFSRGDCDGKNPLHYGMDGCYLDHIGRTYWKHMTEFCFATSGLGTGLVCPFANYYQFFREILLALAKGGRFILLHDERNPAFLKESKKGKTSGLWPFLTESVSEKYAGRIGRITMQQVVSSIEGSERHDDWIEEFKLKYGIT